MLSEVKWIKITTSMFEDDKIDYIESLPEKDAILVIWIKLLALAGKCNDRGDIYLTPELRYTADMLAHRLKRPLNTVKLALGILATLGMIRFIEGEELLISNWEKHQNIDGMEKIREQTRKRVAKHRENQKQLKEPGPEKDKNNSGNVTCNVTVTQSNAIDKDIDKDIDKESDIESDIDDDDREEINQSSSSRVDNVDNFKLIETEWNKVKKQLIKIDVHKELASSLISKYELKDILAAINKISESQYLSKNASIDWFLQEKNFIKVINNKYKDFEKESKGTDAKSTFHNFPQVSSQYSNDELEAIWRKK